LKDLGIDRKKAALAKRLAELPDQAVPSTMREAKRRAKEERNRRKQEPREKVPPLTLAATRGETRPAERAYSVEEWEALPKSERIDIIAAGFDCRAALNDQPGTDIEWARRSLNTVTGCLHDCPYCYARDIATKPGREKLYPYGFAPTFHPSRLSAPGRTKLPPEARRDPAYRNIFANSMSDLFGKWVPADWIEATIEMARRNPQWNFLTLTKFPQRAAEFEFPTNWWMGTTVDAQARVAAAEKAFAQIRCGTKWLSVEPLLQPLVFARLDIFQWIVIGGASVSTQTPAWTPPLDWQAALHVAAREAGVRIYYKTNSGLGDSIRVREFPWTSATPRALPSEFQYLKGL
jgi:protein gp37